MSWRLSALVALGLVSGVVLAHLTQESDSASRSWDALRAAASHAYLLLWFSTVSGIAVRLRIRLASAPITWLLEAHACPAPSPLRSSRAMSPASSPTPGPTSPLWTSRSARPAPTAGGSSSGVDRDVAHRHRPALNRSRRPHEERHLALTALPRLPAYLASLLHGVTAGTDSAAAPAVGLYAATAAVVAALFAVRLLQPRTARGHRSRLRWLRGRPSRPPRNPDRQSVVSPGPAGTPHCSAPARGSLAPADCRPPCRPLQDGLPVVHARGRVQRGRGFETRVHVVPEHMRPQVSVVPGVVPEQVPEPGLEVRPLCVRERRDPVQFAHRSRRITAKPGRVVRQVQRRKEQLPQSHTPAVQVLRRDIASTSPSGALTLSKCRETPRALPAPSTSAPASGSAPPRSRVPSASR